MSAFADGAWDGPPEGSDDAEPFEEQTRDTAPMPEPVCDVERCPRCNEADCTPECIAEEETECNAYTGPTPRKYT